MVRYYKQQQRKQQQQQQQLTHESFFARACVPLVSSYFLIGKQQGVCLGEATHKLTVGAARAVKAAHAPVVVVVVARAVADLKGDTQRRIKRLTFPFRRRHRRSINGH